MYIKLCPDHFADEQAQITWALSFMKDGRAANLANRVLHTEARTRRPFYENWAAFEEAFKTAFCPQNEAVMAMNKLESTKYYQGRTTVEEYIDEFSSLIAEAGYYDGQAIVMKFRRGLDRTTQDKIAEMGRDRPRDDDVDAWYAAARIIDDNRAANLAFHAATPIHHVPPPRGFSIRMPAPEQPRSIPPNPQNPTKPRFDPATCRRCGKLGHFAKECPLSHDVRFMTSEELEDWVQQRNVAKDVAETWDREEVQETKSSETDDEDFTSRSE
jgi:hypothetical protein